MDVDPPSCADEVAYQIGALEVFARAAGTRVPLRQAARRALQPRRARRGAGRAVVEAVLVVDAGAARARAARLALLRPGRQAGLPSRPGGVRGPRVHRRRARWCRAARTAPCCTTPDAVVARCVRLATERHGPGRRRQRRRGRRPLPVPARRHPGRGGPGPSGAEGARGGRRRGWRRSWGPLMRVLPCGEHAALVELEDLNEVLGLYATLRHDPPEGVTGLCRRRARCSSASTRPCSASTASPPRFAAARSDRRRTTTATRCASR